MKTNARNLFAYLYTFGCTPCGVVFYLADSFVSAHLDAVGLAFGQAFDNLADSFVRGDAYGFCCCACFVLQLVTACLAVLAPDDLD